MRSHQLRVAVVLIVLACSTLAACERVDAVLACDSTDPRVRVAGRGGAWEASGLAPSLHEVWRAAAEGDGARIGFPASLAASAGGQLALADFEMDRVLVFPADGTAPVSWPIGHTLAKPVAVAWMEDGGLRIFDLGASVVLATDSTGGLLGQIPVPGSMLQETMVQGGLDWAGVLPDGTVLFQPLPPFRDDARDPGQSEWSIWRFPPHAAIPDTLAAAPARLFGSTMRARVPVPAWPRLRGATGSGGLLAVGGADAEYRITLMDAGGDTVRIVCRDTPPLPLSERERGDGVHEVEAGLLREALPPHPAAFGHFFPGADGALWVQRDRPFTLDDDELTPVHGNEGGTFDLFAPDGGYLGELTAPPGVRLRAAAGERVYGLESGGLGRVELVAYRLVVGPSWP